MARSGSPFEHIFLRFGADCMDMLRNPYWPQQGLRNYSHPQKGQAEPAQGPVIEEDSIREVSCEGGRRICSI